MFDRKMLDKTMKRWMQGALICLLGTIMLGAGGPDASARFGRVGGNLMCMCSCGQMLLQCNHVNCPDSGPMIQELQDQIAGPNGAGADSLILNWFVAKYGATVLAAPIRGGFDNVAWIVPIALFLLGTLGTAMLVRIWSKRQRLVTAAGGMGMGYMDADSMDAGLRARIRRETDLS